MEKQLAQVRLLWEYLLVLGFIASLWSEEMITYIILIGVLVGLGFILYLNKFKYNGGIF